MVGEEVNFLSGKDQWQIGTVVGTRDTGRSYDILTGEGTSLRRNKSHLKPRSFDIPIISQYFTSRTSTPSQSEIFSSYNNNSDFDTCTPSQSEISEYDVNSESSSRETSRQSSPVRQSYNKDTVLTPP